MKQLLILGKNLTIKQILAVDNIIPIEDIISPQKTVFTVPINRELVVGDLVILKKEQDFEYFGIVQDLESDEVTRVSAYPLINLTNGEFNLTTIDGDVYQWIVNTFTKNFIDIDDDLLRMPFVFKNNAQATTLYLELQDGNLFDALLTVFKKTGIYLKFSLGYENGRAKNIICTVEKSSEVNKTTIRYDNPIVFEVPLIELSQSQDINKVIFKPQDDLAGNNIYSFYLLDNNTVTTNANAMGRINGVVQTIQYYTAEENSIETLKRKAEELMLGDTLNHQITLKVVNNSSYNFKLYDKVEYIDKKMKDGRNRVFETYVTRIENNNEVYKVLRLGVLRTTLTDKVKALEKSISGGIKTSGNSGGGSGGAVSSVNGKTGAVVLTSTDVGALSNSTKYGSSLSLIIDNSTYVLTAQLKDQNGSVLATSNSIDLPLETMVVNGSYDSATKEVILTLDNGNTVKFSVADLVSGLQNEITATNKLASDLVDDTDQNNKFMTANEKSKLSGIQEGAQKNPTNYVTTNTEQDITSKKRFKIAQRIYTEYGWDSLSACITPSSKLDNADANVISNAVRPVLELDVKILENNSVIHKSVVQKFQDKNGTIALLEDLENAGGGSKIIWREWN